MTSHIKTEAEASADWLCPLARTFADNPANPRCRGSSCPVWRWEPIPASTLTEAVKKRQAETFIWLRQTCPEGVSLSDHIVSILVDAMNEESR